MEQNVINVIQGEFHVSNRAGDVLTTILGSCVAACVYDRARGLGGMNHFLLPGADPRDRQNIKYGAYAMEQLINAVLRKGAQRGDLEAKLFGGASVVRSLSDIGKSNADFARAFLLDEGIRLISHCLGGTQGRRIRFWPGTGRVQVLKMSVSVAEPAVRESAAPPHLGAGKPSGEVDLF